MEPLTILFILTFVATLDVAACRLSPSARLLWFLMLVCIPGISLVAWCLTRHTAYHPAPAPAPEVEPAPEA